MSFSSEKIKKLYILVAVVVALAVSSCYKIISTSAPREVAQGETFKVTLTVADDGSDTQNFVTDWSYAGLRVPEGWTVKTSGACHEQFAEEWVYYSDGSQAAQKTGMKACDKLTAFYNEACPKKGYTWFAFQTRTMVPKNISACWRNGCDSIRVTLTVTVPTDCKPGTYTLDFLGGDEEDEAGVDKYASLADTGDSRLFHVGTFANSRVENRAADYALKVTVVEDESVGVEKVSGGSMASPQTNIYTIDGKRVEKAGKGIYIKDGKKHVRL